MSGPDPTEKQGEPWDVVGWLDAIDATPYVEADQAAANDNGKVKASDAAGTAAHPSNAPDSYSIERMNERYALVLMGSKAFVLDENPNAPLEDRHAIRSIEAFRAWFANRFTIVPAGKDGTKAVTWASRWLVDRDRRQYQGIVFHPAPDETNPEPPGYFNLWRGFSYEPKQKPNGYGIFRDHVFTNVCDSRQDWFDYVFGWMAHLVQRPRERIGIALVLRGKMGTGKTKIGEVLGALFRSHYFIVDDPRYVTGQFNAHMASCLLLQADEAVWAGDKTAEGRLKGLITATTQMIENKGVDPIRVDNFVRLLMTSNEGWVVPAGKDERRYAVFDVGDRCAQNADYFRELDEEMRNGGYEALLHDLLAFDLSKVDLRRAPRTQALLDQKIRTFGTVDGWWFEKLMAGAPTRKHPSWSTEVEIADMFSDYVDYSEKAPTSRRSRPQEFGMDLRKLVPTLAVKRLKRWSGEGAKQVCERPRVYLLPSLAEARREFEKVLGQSVEWHDDSDVDPYDERES